MVLVKQRVKCECDRSGNGDLWRKIRNNVDSTEQKKKKRQRQKRNASKKWRRISSLPDFLFPFRVDSSIVLEYMLLFRFFCCSNDQNECETYIYRSRIFCTHHTRTNKSDKIEKQITQTNITNPDTLQHSHIMIFYFIAEKKNFHFAQKKMIRL